MGASRKSAMRRRPETAGGEAEILGRGHRIFRLRVLKSNTAAIKFYQRQGWQIGREIPHKRFAVVMLEMIKSALRGED